MSRVSCLTLEPGQCKPVQAGKAGSPAHEATAAGAARPDRHSSTPVGALLFAGSGVPEVAGMPPGPCQLHQTCCDATLSWTEAGRMQEVVLPLPALQGLLSSGHLLRPEP